MSELMRTAARVDEQHTTMELTNTAEREPRNNNPPINEALDPFRPENLRLSQNFTEVVPVKKVLVTVPVRKPHSQDFIRVRPGAEWRDSFPLIELKTEREEYIVTASLVAELMSEIVCVTLYLAINRQGAVFLWPVRLPGPDGKDLDWWRSAREAAALAENSWVRVRANMSAGSYDIGEATNNSAQPEWPLDLAYWDIIKIAFRDRIIDRLDHPVIQRLRGLI
jgi:hypothetical protein